MNYFSEDAEMTPDDLLGQWAAYRCENELIELSMRVRL